MDHIFAITECPAASDHSASTWPIVLLSMLYMSAYLAVINDRKGITISRDAIFTIHLAFLKLFSQAKIYI